MVICLERGADLHMAQLMPLPLTVSCFSKIQIGFTFLVLAYPGSPRQRAVKRVCVCVCVNLLQGSKLNEQVRPYLKHCCLAAFESVSRDLPRMTSVQGQTAPGRQEMKMGEGGVFL